MSHHNDDDKKIRVMLQRFSTPIPETPLHDETELWRKINTENKNRVIWQWSIRSFAVVAMIVCLFLAHRHYKNIQQLEIDALLTDAQSYLDEDTESFEWFEEWENLASEVEYAQNLQKN